MDDLPSEYDAIVIGTGMTECIVAAALSRIGQKVLHLDRNDCYSGDWATYHLKGLQEWIHKKQSLTEEDRLEIKSVDLDKVLQSGEKTLSLQVESVSISNLTNHIYIKEKEEVVIEATSSKETEKVKLEECKENEENNESVDNPCATNNPSLPCDEKDADSSNPAADDKESLGVVADKRKEWTLEALEKEFRKFNIDLQPRVLYSNGAMVELLISSDIAKYCEFRTITRVLANINGRFEKVPCSRSDVFSSKQVSMIEKRMLMKLLTFCLDFEKHPEEYEGFADKTFVEFLKSKKLTANVMHYVKHAIAMVTDETLTLEGLKRTQKFLRSLGRYGNTAFLWPLYGSGELPQCFCRMCAVFGGIYCLKRTGTELIISAENKCLGIIDTEGVRLNSKVVIAESSYLKEDASWQDKCSSISRAVFFTDKSILPDEQDHISLLSLPPPAGHQRRTTVFELSSLSLACPKDVYIVHMSCQGINTPEEDFTEAVKLLFKPTQSESSLEDDSRPSILWSLYFSQRDTTTVNFNTLYPDNLYIVDGPDLDIDFDYSISQAKQIFESICPGEDFLPKAPNPEDIIFDDAGVTPGEGGGFEPEDKGDSESKDDGNELESKGESESKDDGNELKSKGKSESKDDGNELKSKGESESKDYGNELESKEEVSKEVSKDNITVDSQRASVQAKGDGEGIEVNNVNSESRDNTVSESNITTDEGNVAQSNSSQELKSDELSSDLQRMDLMKEASDLSKGKE